MSHVNLELSGRQKALHTAIAVVLLLAVVDQHVRLQTGVRDELGVALPTLELFVAATVRLPVHPGVVKGEINYQVNTIIN